MKKLVLGLLSCFVLHVAAPVFAADKAEDGAKKEAKKKAKKSKKCQSLTGILFKCLQQKLN